MIITETNYSLIRTYGNIAVILRDDGCRELWVRDELGTLEISGANYAFPEVCLDEDDIHYYRNL
jgi:hypothetical protein